jgi:hypothetical protein
MLGVPYPFGLSRHPDSGWGGGDLLGCYLELETKLGIRSNALLYSTLSGVGHATFPEPQAQEGG